MILRKTKLAELIINKNLIQNLNELHKAEVRPKLFFIQRNNSSNLNII